MKKKMFCTLSLLALVGGFAAGLASCGPATTSGGETNPDVDPIIPEGDPTSEVTISFWHCMGHDRTDAVNKIVKEFNEKWKGKYKVELSKLSGDYDSLDDTVRTRLQSGEVPGLTMAYPDSIAQYISNDIEYSAVFRLNNYINDDEVGYTQEELDDFVDQYWAEGNSYHYSGTWSMPFYKSTEIMYYNDNYFHGDNAQNDAKFASNSTYNTLKAAITTAQSTGDYDTMTTALENLKSWAQENGGYTYEVPTTWDEAVSLGRQMIADRKAENCGGTFFPLGYDSDANFIISQLAQRGLAYTTNDNINDPTDHFVFNNQDTIDFLTEVTALIKEGVFVTGETSGVSYTNTLFTAKETAMTIGSTGGSSYNVSSNFRVSLAEVPYAGENQLYIQQGPSICFFIQNDPYVQKGAWLFYKAMAETEANTELALESSYDPVRDSCYETKTYTDWISKYKEDLIYDIPNHTKDFRDKLMVSEVFIGSDVARDQMDTLISQIVSSNVPVATAVNNAYMACEAAVI